MHMLSTAVIQAVACAPVTQPGFDPRSGQISWVKFFGFFLTCKTNVRNLQAHTVPEYHLAAIIIISYSPFWNE